MYLAYADDSGTGDKKEPWQVMCTVIIEDKKFTDLEVHLGAIVEQLLPREKWEEFEEFHACELYKGYGVFKDIEQVRRFEVITAILNQVNRCEIPIIYSAIQKSHLARTDYGSADPLDVCFRRCVEGMHNWLFKGQLLSLGEDHFALLIVDDSNGNTKNTLRKSFRELRHHLRVPNSLTDTSWHLHDEMYFGSSRDSVGIQVADICAYFIRKHLDGGDPAADGFYGQFKDRIVDSKKEPDESDDDRISWNDANEKDEAAQ